MGVFHMVNQLVNRILSNTVVAPSYIQHAVVKMDRTIQRMDTNRHVQLFKTDYLE